MTHAADPPTVSMISALFGLGFTLLLTWAGVIIWAIRQEGRITNESNERKALEREKTLEIKIVADALASADALHKVEMAGLQRELSQAISALTRFNESTQAQVDQYKNHTEVKIDGLSREVNLKLDKIFDKLDGKMDK